MGNMINVLEKLVSHAHLLQNYYSVTSWTPTNHDRANKIISEPQTVIELIIYTQ